MPVKRKAVKLDPSLAAVVRLLRNEYGRPHHFNKKDPLGELVYFLLSTQTREAEYRRTFSVLWTTYRSWERVRQAPDDELVELIRFGGFARRKVGLLKSLLNQVRDTHGRTSLRWIRGMSDDEVLSYLVSLPGVGLKTARCVQMYSLRRPVLPVDTHVWRISKRLGWIQGGKHPDDRRSLEFEAEVPARHRYALHVTLVSHGRLVCRASPRCNLCVLARLCPSEFER